MHCDAMQYLVFFYLVLQYTGILCRGSHGFQSLLLDSNPLQDT